MKILVAGDVDGCFKQLFSRVRSILTKNKDFELLLCVGSFFSCSPECQQEWDKYKDGEETVPIPTFILGPSSTEHAQYFEGMSADGGELCTNVTCLGQRGVYRTSSGLQLAYLSGSYDRRQFTGGPKRESQLRSYFTKADLSSIESQCNGDNFNGVDILLTSEWPKGIERFTQPPDNLDMTHIGGGPLSRLAMVLKPRYHFASLQHTFYERVPYRNHQVLQSKQQHVTRFIALAQVGNPNKKNRYLYAFSISPMSSMDEKELIQQPPVATDCPYTDIVKAMGSQDDASDQNFFYDQRAIEAAKRKQRRQQQRQEGGGAPPAKRQARRPPPQPRGPCWFCLGGTEVEKHLVVSIGDHTYLALPKGGLVPEHVLALPIGHYAASTDASPEVLEELNKFRSSLRKYFQSKDQSCVIFERNFKSHHLQLQVVPVPKTPSDALRQAFIDHGKSVGVFLETIPRDTPISELAHPGVPYFHAEFDDGGSLFTRIKGRFSLQFGREVLASQLILNLPDRVNWKSCTSSKDEETTSAQTMRKNFEPFDFTTEEDED